MSSFEEFDFQADDTVHQHPFTIVYNQLIESNVSPSAFRLLTYMCSKPKGWKFHDHKLREVCQCGENKFKDLVKELKDLGYMQTVSIPSGLGDGKFKGSKRLFSGRPIFKNTEGLVFGQSAEPTVGKVNPEVNNTERHNNTERLESSSRAEKAEDQEKVNAMARLAELHRGEQAKLRSRPRPVPEPEGEFRYEPTVVHPIADDDKPLSDELYDEGVSKGCILALLRAYPNRAHIRQSLTKLRHSIKTKGVKNPDGFMRHVMNDPYEEPRVSKTALKEADKLRQSALEKQKRDREYEEGMKRREALQANPVALESKMSELRNALKKGRQAGMTAH